MLQNEVKSQLNDMKKDRHIPEYLMCPLKLDFMEEPVVLSSGFTYEKTDIQSHFNVNGKTDPQTREEVDGTLVANQSIKHATEEFLEQNPWAHDFSLYDNLDTLKM